MKSNFYKSVAAVFAVTLTAPFSFALDSGSYLVTKKEFVGPEETLKEYKEAFLYGQLMYQMENREDVVYAEYDRNSNTLSMHTPDEITEYQVNEDEISFSGPNKKTEKLIKLDDTSFTIQDAFESEIYINIRMEKVEDQDPKIIEYKKLIEAKHKAKEEQTIKFKEQISTPAEGVKVRLGKTELGVVLPVWAKYVEEKTLKSGITRYTFKDARDTFSESLFFFLATTQEQVGELDSDLYYTDKNIIVFEDGTTQLIKKFDDYLSVSKIETSSGTLFSYGRLNDPSESLGWAQSLQTANSYDKIDAPDLAALVETPELLDQLNNVFTIDDREISTCIRKILDVSQSLKGLLKSFTIEKCDFITNTHDSFEIPDVDVEFKLTHHDTTDLDSHIIRLDASAQDEENNDKSASLYSSNETVINRDDFFGDRYEVFQSIPINKSIDLVANIKAKDIYSAILVIHSLKEYDWGKVNIPEKYGQYLGKYHAWSSDSESEFLTIRNSEGLEGVITKDGDTIVPPEYEDIDATEYGFIVENDDEPRKVGYFSKNGNTRIPAIHNRIESINEKFLLIEVDENSYKIYDLLNNEYSNAEYKKIDIDYALNEINPSLVIITGVDEKKEILDVETGKIISKKFDHINVKKEANLFILRDNSLSTFYHTDLTPALEGSFSYTQHVFDSSFIVEKDGLKGLINVETGKEIIPVQYDKLWPHWKAKLVFARKDNDETYFNYTGQRILPKGLTPLFAPDEDGNLTVKDENNNHGVITNAGAELIKPSYKMLYQFKHGYLPAQPKGKGFGLIDKNENVVIDFIYQNIYLPSEETVWAKKEDKWGLLDLKGNELVPFMYDEVSKTHETDSPKDRSRIKVLLVKKDGKFGIVDWITGEQLTPIDFEIEYEHSLTLKKGGKRYSFPRDFRKKDN